ncbi:MAG: endonuclease/exonuclease/phosphatase family protein [Clostridia bacterium]|nr:endonuclease/exonuclease/phosphatase family protein [Clostridia bacterium]
MKLVTFNIRCAWAADGINSFLHRAGAIAHKVNAEKPDVICFQECTGSIYEMLKTVLSDYHIVFNQRNADLKGEGLATALRKNSAELLGLEAFWLSPTPYLPGSRYKEQSSCPRICQCVTVRCEEKIFRVYNLHLDHESDLARRLGMEATLRRVKEDLEKIPFPFFILGDFNATPESAPITYCGDNPLVSLAELTTPITHTFHNYGKIADSCKIDYIFSDVNTALLPHSVTPWADESDGIFLSDHYPLALTITM